MTEDTRARARALAEKLAREYVSLREFAKSWWPVGWAITFAYGLLCGLVTYLVQQ